MSNVNFDKYGSEEFFKLFLEAVKETYGDYCTFKEHEENHTEYSEPVFEKSIEEAERRLCSIVQKLENANERVRELEKENSEYAKCIISISERVDVQDFIKNNPTYESARTQLNKFAIEKKIEVFNEWIYEVKFMEGLSARDVIESAVMYAEQLRKEQE